MVLQRGDIVLVPFPFTDLSRQKARPAVVVSPQDFNARSPDIILAAISSRLPDLPDDFELVIQSDAAVFQPTGLRASSVIRVSKLVTMKQSLIYSTLGKLHERTFRMLDEYLARTVGLPALQVEIAARQMAEVRVNDLAVRLARLEQRLAELGLS